MGGISSRPPQFQRTKSLSNYGRSSQRGLFQKSKAKLRQIDKKLQTEGIDSTTRDELQKQLDDLERELNNVSASVKNKNKHKYEDVLKHLQETRAKLEGTVTTVTPAQEGEGDATAEKTEKTTKISFGRSSQRGLFQKSKTRLKEIDKQLEKSESDDVIKRQLDDIEKELNAISATLKDKNKKQHEEVLKHLQETRQNFESKLKPNQESQPEIQETPKPEIRPRTVEITLVKVIGSIENLDEKKEEEVEIRKHQPEIDVRSSQPSSPKIKFGVQVMPTTPRISQDLLKRNTLPINEGPKAEFQKIRIASDSAVMSQKHNSSVINNNELYNLHLPPRLPEDYESSVNSDQDGIPPSPNSDKEQRESLPPKKPPRLIKETSVEENALDQIESIGRVIDELEKKLRFFSGKKGDRDYIELHERFVRCMINLDNIETNGDPVVKQERKISIQRVQELLVILERLVDVEEKKDDSEDIKDDAVGEFHEEIFNAEGKPIAATAL